MQQRSFDRPLYFNLNRKVEPLALLRECVDKKLAPVPGELAEECLALVLGVPLGLLPQPLFGPFREIERRTLIGWCSVSEAAIDNRPYQHQRLLARWGTDEHRVRQG